MRKTVRALVATAAAAGLTTFALIQPAAAHEGRAVGDHEFVVGFGTEPAYAGFPNSVQVLIAHHDGEPVTKIDGQLDAEVEFGEETRELKLEPNFVVGEFGEPGDYRAWFIPTRPGGYTFRVFGEMEGEEIDESFSSGPDTFSEVANPTAEGFPAGDPTTGELAERLDREVPRLNDRIAAAQSSAQASAEDAAGSARTLAIVGIVVGALGLLAGGAALSAARRRGIAT